MQKIIHLLQSADLLVIVAAVSCCLFAIMMKGMDAKDKMVSFIIILYSLVDVATFIMGALLIHNQWLYSILLLPQLVLVVGILVYDLQSKMIKKALIYSGIVIVVLHILNMSIGQGYHVLCTYTYIPACVLMAASAFFFLKDQFEHSDTSPFNSLLSWFALATLIDYAGAIPILATLSWPELYDNKSLLFLWNIVKYLYLSWFLINITGLLWTKTSLKSVFYSR